MGNLEDIFSYGKMFLTAAASILALIFNFLLRKKSQHIKFLESSWDKLVNESAELREEVRKDMELLKLDREDLMKKADILDKKILDLSDENLKLKEKELILEARIRELEEDLKDAKS